MASDPPFRDEEVAACLRVLRALADDRALLPRLADTDRRALLIAAGRLAQPGPEDRRRLARAFRRRDRDQVRAHDAALVAATRNRAMRRSPAIVLPGSTADDRGAAPPAEERGELRRPRDCYVCKQPFRRLHHFYDSLCPACAELNYRKRFQSAPLDGRVALVTGARIKIGYQIALALLRAGAEVIATTRFPHEAALRYAREPDFAAWSDRLHLHPLDLRFIPEVERFARHVSATARRLDVLVNNAAQTVRRPPAFYAHLAEIEARAAAELPAAESVPLLRADGERGGDRRVLPSPASPVGPEELARASELFPRGQLDLDEQQVDLRATNSWRMTLGEVPTVELIEVHLVNAIAPCVLTGRLKGLLLRDRTDEKHVIHVSAMEARFSRRKKTDKHPHTNMAKAALNMMTRTAAADYLAGGVHMNSVDTGWVTDEDPLVHVERKQRVHDFHPPLDAIDGAARVLNPLFTGLLTGAHPSGLFLKDYRPVEW